MIGIVLELTAALLALAIFCGLYRLARGPSVLDRVLAFDLITTCSVGLLIALSIHWETTLYLELILIVSLLGFLTTVAFVFYLNSSAEPLMEPPPPGAKEPPKL